MAVDRGCYIDQSQSLNIHMDQPNFGKLTSLHFYAWSKVCNSNLQKYLKSGSSYEKFLVETLLLLTSVQGLKTGMYYLRSRAAADAIKFTVDTSALEV